MQVGELLAKAIARLEAAGIATARLDALVLLEDVTGRDRSWLLAHPNERFDVTTLRRFNGMIRRRADHEPLAYIRGKTEFYGREFIVNNHVLEPRPETEDMIDLLKKVWQPGQTIVDVGTGCGAIGITAALELKTDQVDLIDIDDRALQVAQANAQKHGLKLNCRYGDLLAGSEHAYDIILANLPYVPDSHTINEAALQEPKHAIFGGEDGLDLYRRLFAQAPATTYVLTESLPFQHQALEAIAQTSGYRLETNEGFVQIFKRATAPAG